MDYSYLEGLEDIFAFLAVFALIILIILVIFLIFYLIGMYKLYRKSGKNGWECLIPFYSTYVLTEIAGLNWWWFLIADCASLSVLFYDAGAVTSILSLGSTFGRIVIYYNLSKKFNKDTGWFILSIFFGGITLPLLGYSNSTIYYPNAPVSKNGFFDDGTPNQPNNNQYQQYNNYGQPNNNQYQQYNNYGQPMNNQYQQYNNYQTQNNYQQNTNNNINNQNNNLQ